MWARIRYLSTTRKSRLPRRNLPCSNTYCKVCRRQLIENVWDIHFEYNTGVIDVYMNALRKKLGLSKDDDYLQTIRGVGYVARD